MSPTTPPASASSPSGDAVAAYLHLLRTQHDVPPLTSSPQKASHGEQILAAAHGHEPDPVGHAWLVASRGGYPEWPGISSASTLCIYDNSGAVLLRATLGEILERFRQPATRPIAEQIAKEGL